MPADQKQNSTNKYYLKTNNFAPWGMDDCTCSMMLNGEYVEKKFKVKGENKGRTTNEWAINANLIKFNGDDNVILIAWHDQ